MATKHVTPDVKPDKSQGQASGIKPSDVKRDEEIQKMIDFINTYTDHQVVTKAEYDQPPGACFATSCSVAWRMG